MRILTPWTQQPQVPVEIDWSNPITRGLVSAILPHTKRDAVLQYFLPGSSGAISTKATSSGFALVTAGLNSSIYTTATAAQRVSDGTLLWLGDTYATPSNSACLGGVTYDSANSYPYVCIEFKRNPGGAGVDSLSFACSAGGSNRELNTANSYQPMAGRLLIGTSRSGYQAFWVGRVGAVSLDQQNTYAGSLASTATSRIEVGDSLNSRNPDASCTVMALWNRALSDAEIRNISQNPWQIFKPIPRRIFVPVSAATGDGTGIGSLYAITLSSPTATAAGTANATATGSLATSTLTAPSGSASGSALATASLASLSTSAPSATATGSALASGALATITLTTIPATATGSALATGTIDQIDLSTVTGNATGTTAGNATGVGSVATIALSAPVATALGTALATGNFASIGLGTVSGSASAATDGQATAVIQPISISAPLAIAIASSVATGGIQSIGLTAPTGTASGQAQTIARPNADISNTGWTPSTGSDLYAMLDEVSPDDADYISTSTLGAVCKMSLNATQYPGGASQQLSLRASSSTGNGLSVTIKDGATTIATRTLTLTPTFDLHTITLTSGEIAAITSGNLTVEMTST